MEQSWVDIGDWDSIENVPTFLSLECWGRSVCMKRLDVVWKIPLKRRLGRKVLCRVLKFGIKQVIVVSLCRDTGYETNARFWCIERDTQRYPEKECGRSS